MEIADHFLAPPHFALSEPLFEQLILPADPSTLPGGVETLLSPIDLLEHNDDEDDWCSFIASDHDTRSMCSNLSTAGSDMAPKPESVPCVSPIVEMIGADDEDVCILRLAPPLAPPLAQPRRKAAVVAPAAAAMKLEPKPIQLAPRPAGMSVTDGFIWQMGAFGGNEPALVAKLNSLEKQRKAEDRRRKNRQAAARSNARKKDIMDGIRAQIKVQKNKEGRLRNKQSKLRTENELLRRQVGTQPQCSP